MDICDYGCGREANYTFKNGNRCCSSHWLKCPKQKKSLKGENNPFFGKKHTDESKIKVGEKNKGRVAWNKGIPRTIDEKKFISKKTKEEMAKPEIKKKLKDSRPNFKKENHPNWKGGYYTRKLPLYSTYMPQIVYAEECRKNKDDKNILEVKCAYCGVWFIPTITQIYERMRSLTGKNYGEQRLYCSEKCKKECPIFHQILYSKDNKPETSREVQPELRQMRFKVDNYTCKRCNKHKDKLDVGLHCHHIEGVRWEPLESADIDKCITYCKICHIIIHKKDGCGYNDMKCLPIST